MSDAIAVRDLTKHFRIPMDRSSTLKHRVVHPFASSRYRDFAALEDITFSVPSGQFVGVIGHNGSGKSTLLKLLAKIYRPTSGAIAINGKVSPFLELGVGFNPELTARENVYLNGAVLGLTRSELNRIFDDIISFAELEEHVDQKVKTFSSGMEVRLAFSVAIRANADILLMDEVLAVGDSRFQLKCFDVFAEYKRQGRTVVLVTHDTSAVEQYCDRAILLDHGRLLADGDASEITSRYRRLMGQRDEGGLGSLEEASGLADSRRWGTGDVRVASVQILDEQGEAHTALTSGKPATVRLTLEGVNAVEDLVVGVSFHRLDGYTIAGTNTAISGTPISAPAPGTELTVEYRIPSLTLLGGRFKLTVAAHSRLGSAVYDRLDQLYEFEVIDETARVGLVEPGGTWWVGSARAPAELGSSSSPAAAAPRRRSSASRPRGVSAAQGTDQTLTP